MKRRRKEKLVPKLVAVICVWTSKQTVNVMYFDVCRQNNPLVNCTESNLMRLTDLFGDDDSVVWAHSDGDGDGWC